MKANANSLTKRRWFRALTRLGQALHRLSAGESERHLASECASRLARVTTDIATIDMDRGKSYFRCMCRFLVYASASIVLAMSGCPNSAKAAAEERIERLKSHIAMPPPFVSRFTFTRIDYTALMPSVVTNKTNFFHAIAGDDFFLFRDLTSPDGFGVFTNVGQTLALRSGREHWMFKPDVGYFYWVDSESETNKHNVVSATFDAWHNHIQNVMRFGLRDIGTNAVFWAGQDITTSTVDGRRVFGQLLLDEPAAPVMLRVNYESSSTLNLPAKGHIVVYDYPKSLTANAIPSGVRTYPFVFSRESIPLPRSFVGIPPIYHYTDITIETNIIDQALLSKYSISNLLTVSPHKYMVVTNGANHFFGESSDPQDVGAYNENR